MTDPEHDSAYALSLPLVGVEFGDISYHTAEFSGWVDNCDPHGFHVPDPGYNPLQDKGVVICKVYPDCKRKPHKVVPEGFFVPPVNPTLYQKVRGMRVTIRISTPVGGRRGKSQTV